MSTRRERAKAQNAQQSRPMPVAVQAEKKEHPIAKKLGDFFVDVSKLIIGGVILAGLMKTGHRLSNSFYCRRYHGYFVPVIRNMVD
jgi:hypothetical protein